MNDIITSIAADQSSGLVSLVLSRAADEIQLTCNLKDDLKDLGLQLKIFQMILSGEQSVVALRRNPLIRSLLTDVKNIAYEADDLLDDYACESFRRSLPREKSTTCFTYFLECIFSVTNPLIFRVQMAHRVKDLRSSIDETYRQAQVLGIELAELTEPARSREININRSTTMTDGARRLEQERASPDASDLIGRANDIDHIVNTICHSTGMVEGRFELFAVVGTAGLGKTALLRSVSKHPSVEAHFKKRILWICVSYHFNTTEFLVKMAEQLLGECKTSDHEAILKKLNSELSNQSYLLVLDDVWNTMTYRLWDTIVGWLKEICHPLGQPTVLVTTRSNEVAELMQSRSTRHFTYDLRELSPTDSWSLFCRRVNVDKNMEDISTRMVERCKGVPLAIKVLASTLKARRNHWDEIEQSEIWDLDDNEGIMPSLRLSFDYLPNMAIKRCFEYCAIFEEDAEIERENLIQLWVSQGLIKFEEDQKVSLERIGDQYFNILLNNCLFQDVEEDYCGNVKSCKMHDAVRALAQQVSKGEWLTLNQNVKELNSDSNTWHVRLTSEPYMDQIEPNRKVRTMVVKLKKCRSTTLSNVLERVKHLRVLCLTGIGLKELPNMVGDLTHLRYLDISQNLFRELPADVITNLWSLQTFRYIQYDPRIQFSRDFEWNKLVSIRHIFIDDTIPIPKALEQLTCLQTVPSLCLIDAPGRLSDLGPLTNVRGKLELEGLEEVRSEEEAIEAKLGLKPDIVELSLTWTRGHCASDKEEQVLRALQPHRNLNALKIIYYMGKELPRWLVQMTAFGGSTFSSLVYLRLVGCNNIAALPSSTIVPSLKQLRVEHGHGLTSVNVGCFPSLERLGIYNCSKLSCISTSSMVHQVLRYLTVTDCNILTDLDLSCFPSLLELSIQYCVQFSCISPNGFENCTKLQSLIIRYCNSLESIPNLKPLQNLKELRINACSSIRSKIDGIKDLPNLERLDLGPFSEQLDHFPFEELSPANDDVIPSYSTSLKELYLYQWKSVDSLSSLFQHCTCLEIVHIVGLYDLEALPEWFGKLKSLNYLNLGELPKLEFLPSRNETEQCNTRLGVSNCPLLPQHIQGYVPWAAEKLDPFWSWVKAYRLP